MSRSNPTENNTHPALRWIEWGGSDGQLKYYDKEAKENVDMGDDFTFILLDQLGCVKGWHDSSDSGIYSNEVKSTQNEVMTVKAFKGGVLAQGIYSDIRDSIHAHGGHFVANCYIAFKLESKLAIGSIQFKGAALKSWMEFTKKNKADLYKKAVRIKGSDDGKKGKVEFKTPKFTLIPLTEETNEEATKLDMELQTYLKSYLSRNKSTQPAEQQVQKEPPAQRKEEPDPDLDPASEDDIPF